MNKTEKIISIVLGAIFAWYLFVEMPKANRAKEQSRRAAAVAAQTARKPSQEAVVPAQAAAKTAAAAERERAKTPSEPEKILTLENDELKLELTTWGGAVKKAVLKQFRRDPGGGNEQDNPPVELDFSSSPLGSISAAAEEPPAVYSVKSSGPSEVVFVSAGGVVRKVTLEKNYIVKFNDEGLPAGRTSVSLGAMAIEPGADGMLSVDSWVEDASAGRVVHHCEGDSPLKGFLAGGVSGGCSGSRSAAGMPAMSSVDYTAPQKWVALKNRFFVSAIAGVQGTGEKKSVLFSGFSADVERDMNAAQYRPGSISARAHFNAPGGVEMMFYVGPKKQALLWDLGMKDVMEFGMWRVICYPLVWVLNFFHSFVPNYGVAIILLTILVRLVFWPLSHKSTVGMKKMQELQPRMKEIQAEFKDNPQRLQQEMMALYRENKVNPLSSCLPMLAQIPVFIALFNVLRSAVELRYASFLWIGDLSAPEGLGATSWFPWFGGLNILPVLMAVTMGLQSALTPGTGDRQQKRMMTVFMPVMMLFMFYRFASALSLYWTLSQFVSIVQMWLIRRSAANAAPSSPADVSVLPQTRQMRRHTN